MHTSLHYPPLDDNVAATGPMFLNYYIDTALAMSSQIKNQDLVITCTRGRSQKRKKLTHEVTGTRLDTSAKAREVQLQDFVTIPTYLHDTFTLARVLDAMGAMDGDAEDDEELVAVAAGSGIDGAGKCGLSVERQIAL